MSPVIMLLILTGIAGTALFVSIIYSSNVENHEDDQLFLGAAESEMAKEQEELRVKLNKVELIVRWLYVLTGTLALITFGVWIYTAMNSTNISNFR